MSQDELAEAAGLTRQVISNLERGVSHGYPQTWRRIADVLGVPVDELIEVVEPPIGPPPSSMAALLEQAGAETRYLALPPYELQDLYRRSSYEEAATISRAIAKERDLIDPLMSRAELLPEGEERTLLRKRWSERYVRCYMAGAEMGLIAGKEFERIRARGDDVRAEALREEGDAILMAVGGVD